MANTFKLSSKAGVTSADVIYTVASGTTIILGLILGNTTTSQVTATVTLTSDTANRTNANDEVNQTVELITNAPIPAGSSLELLAGNKVVFETTDSISGYPSGLGTGSIVTIASMSADNAVFDGIGKTEGYGFASTPFIQSQTPVIPGASEAGSPESLSQGAAAIEGAPVSPINPVQSAVQKAAQVTQASREGEAAIETQLNDDMNKIRERFMKRTTSPRNSIDNQVPDVLSYNPQNPYAGIAERNFNVKIPGR